MYLNNEDCETIMGTGPAPPPKKNLEDTLNACIWKVRERVKLVIPQWEKCRLSMKLWCSTPS